MRETATEEEKRALATLFEAVEVRKFRIAGTLRLTGREGWMLDATLTATVVQSCVVTLEPVVTALSEPVRRRFAPGATVTEEDIDAGEAEEDEVDDLAHGINPGLIAIEVAALALPAYPRAEGAIFEGEGDEEDPQDNPFAALAALKGQDGGKQ